MRQVADNSKKGIIIDIPDYALSVMKKIWEAGEEVYIVGGCLRDTLLGKAPNDYDMAVSCSPDRTLEILSDFRTVATGLAHGTVTAISEGRPIELTTFRVDGCYTDMRRPDSVSFTRSIAEDLARRDFTVNAMAYSPKVSLIDLFGGKEDLEAGVIRAVGEAERRFGEDALRIMRAFRFSAQLGFEIEESTLAGARACREGLSRIAKERISAEFIRLICSPSPEKPLLQMKELEILPYVTLGYCPDEKIFSSLAQMPNNDIARLGFFLCDADRDTALSILNHLKCSNKQKSGALAISQNLRREIKTPKDARYLRQRIGEHAVNAARASVLLGYNSHSALSLVEKDRSPCRIADLAIGGKDLSQLGFCGKEVGDTLDFLLGQVIEEPTLNQRDSLLALAKKKRKEE